MAKDLVKLAFIFAIVFTVFSPTIDVVKAEIVEKSNLKPLLEDEIVLATNEVEQAASRRYGPFIRQPIFSSKDVLVRRSERSGKCATHIVVMFCSDCNLSCKYHGKDYGKCDGNEQCYCYGEC